MQPSVAEITIAVVFLLAVLCSCALGCNRFYSAYLNNQGNAWWTCASGCYRFTCKLSSLLFKKLYVLLKAPCMLVWHIIEIMQALYNLCCQIGAFMDAMIFAPIYAVFYIVWLPVTLVTYLCATVYGMCWATKDVLETLDLLTPSHHPRAARSA